MEFLTVATQYCGMLEQCQKQSREELLDSLLRILPVLYWNAQVLPAMETLGQFLPDDQVTEADYEYVRGNARTLLDDWDEYEDDEDYYDPDDEEDEEEPEEGFDFGDEDSTIYEVECACGNVIDFDEEVLESGSIVCPNCGETLEFTFDDDEVEDQ